MKNANRILRFQAFLIVFLILRSGIVFSQSRIDTTSTDKPKKSPLYFYADSINKLRKDQWRIQQQALDSAKAIDDAKRIKAFFQQNPDSIRVIDLTNLVLDTCPHLAQYSSAIALRLMRNNIQEIKKDVWPLSDSLRKVSLSDNLLNKIRFAKNSSIRDLDLSENELKRIPRSIKKLKSLRSINLSHNHIKRIPRFLARMNSLEEVDLNYNQIHQLRKRTIKGLRNLKIIQIGANHISSLPENISICKRVESLNLGKNQLSSIPTSFAELDSLQHLIFYDNEFDSIPAVIWKLHQLKELDFYKNNIAVIPQGIGQLQHLEQLFLAYNKIGSLPDTLQSLMHLKALYLHHNQMIIVPKWIGNFTHLLYLDMGYNKIFELPDMSGMDQLQEVDFQQNNLSEFPYDLLKNTHLNHIYLQGNSFVLTKEEREEMEKLSKKLEEKGVMFYF
jgi:Leucine-rich repeat (LRR) protein